MWKILCEKLILFLRFNFQKEKINLPSKENYIAYTL